MEKEKSYKLGGMVVREFNNRKYLSTALENSSIELIDDIDPVFDTTDDDETSIQIGKIAEQLHDVQVVAVVYLDNHSKRLKCSAKVVAFHNDPEIGKCSKCSKIQRLEACETLPNGRVMVKGKNETIPITLSHMEIP